MRATTNRKEPRSSRAIVVFLGIVLALVLCGAAIVLVSVQQAFAYTYQKTETSSLFNRCWVRATSSGYLEFVGSDPHGPRANMPSFEQPSGWNGYVSSYQFSVANARTLNWTNYAAGNGTWNRGGAVFGHGRVDGLGNGNGFGCVSTYGYGWGGTIASKFGGLDALIYTHVYITDTVWGRNYYGAADFWPRVKIQYHANGGSRAPASHYKYIGTTSTISKNKPVRTGYTFEGWSTTKNGAVNVAPGQRIGYEDWNLKKHMAIAHNWDGGPAEIYDDAATGQPSPTGTNIIPLYAVWKPITYTVVYQGNGATSGSTAPSFHVYDAAKTLTANGFKRAYALTCDAQGGSAGTTSLTCTWNWKNWNTRADGAGGSYADRARIKNIRSSTGTMTFFAQWDAGEVILPDPGQKDGYVFKGWYTEPTDGIYIGDIGSSVSIERNLTYYARWEQLAQVSYYVDGSSEPIFSERVAVGEAYVVNAEANRRGVKADCAGFDGWYLDDACTQAYRDGVPVGTEGLSLYGRNKVLLTYDLTEGSRLIFSQHSCFVDEELSTPLSGGTLPAGDAALPAAQVLWYGDRVAFERGPSVWFESHGRAREATCEVGAYASAAAEGVPVRSIRLVNNTTAYLNWRIPV